MSGYSQAPMLKARGEKKGSNGYWSYDPAIIKFIMRECGSSYSQEHLMLYLMGNQPDKWHCSTADVLEATGIGSKASLSKIKKQLKEKGWIDYKEGEYIMVLYDNIREQMRMGCSEDNPDNNKKTEGYSEKYPQGYSEKYPQGYSQNNHNNIKEQYKKNNITENFAPVEEQEQDKFIF